MVCLFTSSSNTQLRNESDFRSSYETRNAAVATCMQIARALLFSGAANVKHIVPHYSIFSASTGQVAVWHLRHSHCLHNKLIVNAIVLICDASRWDPHCDFSGNGGK